MLKQSPPRSQPKIPKTVWVLGIVSFFTDLGSEMVTSVMPIFLTQVLGGGAIELGVIEGIAEATASITKVFSGVFSDWIGRRKELVLVGYGLAALVKPAFVFAINPAQILAARFVDRLGKGIRVAPRDALVADVVTPENRGAAYGLRQTLDTAGAFLGPIVAAIVLWLAPGQFRTVFGLACIPGFFAIAVILWGLKEPSRRGQESAPKESAPKESVKPKLNWSQWRELPRPYWLLVASVVVFNLGNSSEAFMILRAQNLGLALPLIPLMIVVMNLGYLVSSYPVGLLSDRIGRLGLLQIGWVWYGLIYLGFALAGQQWQLWLLFAGYGLYLGLTQGILKAMVADVTPSHLRGTGFGVFNLAIGVALLPASLLAGGLWELVSPSATFLAGTVLAIVASLMLRSGVRVDEGR